MLSTTVMESVSILSMTIQPNPIDMTVAVYLNINFYQNEIVFCTSVELADEGTFPSVGALLSQDLVHLVDLSEVCLP